MDDRHAWLSLLIVDDNYEAASFMAEELCNYFDFSVDLAVSGPEALERVKANPQGYDVALVDQNLDPEMNGVEVIRQLYLISPILPVILFTGGELEDEYLSAIEEGAYVYLHLQRGVDTDINQLVFHCRAAARDRVMRWQAIFQEMGAAISQQMLHAAGVLDVCVSGLPQLGYAAGAIYRHISGWVPVGQEDADGFRAAEERHYLYIVRSWPTTDTVTSIDLSQALDLKQRLDAGELLIVQPDAHDTEQVMIPLRSTTPLDRTGNLVLGLIVLRHRPNGALQPREVHLLSWLGQQIALALQNALTHRQLEYRRDAADQIMVINARAFRLGMISADTAALLSGAHSIEKLMLLEAETDAILDQFAYSIATAMQFARVVVSVVNRAKGRIQVRGIAVQESYTDIENDPLWRARGKQIDRVEFEKLHRPAYRYYDSYFIPEGCYNFEHYAGFIVHYREVPALPWERSTGDIFRTEVKNAQGQILGYISVDQGEGKRRPDDNMFGTLALFASQIALAIENIYDQKTREALQEIGFQISHTSDLGAVFDTVYQHLQWLMHVKSMVIGRYNEAHREVEVIYRQADHSVDMQLSKRRSVKLGLSGYVIRTGEPLLLRNGTEEFYARHKLPRLGRPAQSWMGVPLKIDGRVIGVIVLQDHEQPGVYDERDLETFRLVAAQLAPTLRRIELEAAKSEAAHKIGQRSIIAQGNLKAIEEFIIRRACEQTRANYGIIRHYDEQTRQLVFSTIYKRDQKLELTNQPKPAIALRPKGLRYSSLSAQAAHRKQPMRWGNVQEAPHYLMVSASTNSQISVPLLTSSSRRLLGVLTLESQEFDAFAQHDEDMLVVLGFYVSIALLRAMEQKRERGALITSLVVRDVSNQIIHHSKAGEARSLSTDLSTASNQFGQLLQHVKDICDQATQLQQTKNVDLRRHDHVYLNAAIQDFFKHYQTLYNDPRVTLKFIRRLDSQQTVIANQLGLHVAVKILIDNAYDAVRKEPNGGTITVITDRDDEHIVLHVTNTGRPVAHQVLKLLQREGDINIADQGLLKLQMLLKFYGATVRLTRNHPQQEVQFTIAFPRPLAEDAADQTTAGHEENDAQHVDPQAFYALQRLQHDIVSYPAFKFAASVLKEVHVLDEEFRRFTVRLDHIQRRVEELRTHVAVDLKAAETLSVYQLLDDFMRSYQKPGSAQADTVFIHAVDLDPSVLIYANRLGLIHILQILLDNAYEAISRCSEAEGKPQARPETITLSTEQRDAAVAIHLHNTGSFIRHDTAEYLFEEPILEDSAKSSERGMGLLMARVLLASFGGAIALTGNSRQTGVQFTIVLPTVPET